MKFTDALRGIPLLASGVIMASLFAAAAVSDTVEVRRVTQSTAADEPSPPAPLAKGEGSDATAAKDTGVVWLSSLNDGYRRAIASRKPVFILVGAKWCPSCRKLAKELESSDVQQELARWTAIRLDMDDQQDDAAALGVTSVPALRIRTAGGQQIAEHTGLLKAEELVEWLAKHFSAATAAADDVLMASDEPGNEAIVRLVKLFQQQNAALREAAIRRLLPYPDVARPLVLKAFQKGSLSARLAAFELLEQWKAPLADLDPWRPETFTAERRVRLEKWKEQPLGEQEPPKTLSAKELADARRQIERMLVADEVEADAIRQRLARLGPALLPEVYSRLKAAAADQDRRRLMILRYRLAARDLLVLRWPGGLERLGDSDPRLRRQAAEELARMAGSGDQNLLLELFADTDPLVREIGLRGLQRIGGKEAKAALVKLLGDPEPNVRAAVLKQLEESPNAAMIPAVVKYLTTEKDPDLIVHAIRFLQGARGKESLKCLISLLKHESWQVRAEAAIAIGKLNDRSVTFTSDSVTIAGGDEPNAAQSDQTNAYLALIGLLDDSDAFVVAKAVEGLAEVDVPTAVEPLAKVASKHPELATSVLTLLSGKYNMRQKAIPYFRKFCKHDKPQVRAAAIAALCGAEPNAAENELLATLADKDGSVRIAAADALFAMLDQSRQAARNQARAVAIAPQNGQQQVTWDMNVVEQPSPSVGESVLSGIAQFFGGSAAKPAATKAKPKIVAMHAKKKADPPKDTPKPQSAKDAKSADQKKAVVKKEEKNPLDEWLEDCYAGNVRCRRKWTAQTVGPLRKMLAAGDAKERLAAALVLVPLGEGPTATAVVLDTVRGHRDLLSKATAVLPWLLWKQRAKAFQELLTLCEDAASRSALIQRMSEGPDRRAADAIWDLLANSKRTDINDAAAMHQALMMIYLGDRYYASSSASPAARRALAAAAKPRAESGSEVQRLVALALLAHASRTEAAALAARLADDSKLTDAVRLDAFQIQLMTQPSGESRKAALAAIKGKDDARKKLAMRFLVQGASALRLLRGTFWVYFDLESVVYTSSSSATPIVPKPPQGLAAKDVRPLAKDSDPETAALANYLLAILGDRDGLEPLIRYWRQYGGNSSEMKKYVYRAIAVVDDPKYIPVLREIYGKYDRSDYELREFYWTIRIMTGSEILKFRKQIRDEVGAARLGS
jgi:HEAT repeat protein